jgi:hypothetical protein
MGEGKGNLGLGMESIKVAMGSSGVYSAAISEARLGNVSADIRKKLSLGDKKSFSEKELNLIGSESVRKDIRKLEDAGYDKKNIDVDHAAVMATTQERYNKVTRDAVQLHGGASSSARRDTGAGR